LHFPQILLTKLEDRLTFLIHLAELDVIIDIYIYIFDTQDF